VEGIRKGSRLGTASAHRSSDCPEVRGGVSGRAIFGSPAGTPSSSRQCVSGQRSSASDAPGHKSRCFPSRCAMSHGRRDTVSWGRHGVARAIARAATRLREPAMLQSPRAMDHSTRWPSSSAAWARRSFGSRRTSGARGDRVVPTTRSAVTAPPLHPQAAQPFGNGEDDAWRV
jgi:hypothetical protein